MNRDESRFLLAAIASVILIALFVGSPGTYQSDQWEDSGSYESSVPEPYTNPIYFSDLSAPLEIQYPQDDEFISGPFYLEVVGQAAESYRDDVTVSIRRFDSDEQQFKASYVPAGNWPSNTMRGSLPDFENLDDGYYEIKVAVTTLGNQNLPAVTYEDSVVVQYQNPFQNEPKLITTYGQPETPARDSRSSSYQPPTPPKQFCGCEKMEVVNKGNISAEFAELAGKRGIQQLGQNVVAVNLVNRDTNQIEDTAYSIVHAFEVRATLEKGSNPDLCGEGQDVKGRVTTTKVNDDGEEERMHTYPVQFLVIETVKDAAGNDKEIILQASDTYTMTLEAIQAQVANIEQQLASQIAGTGRRVRAEARIGKAIKPAPGEQPPEYTFDGYRTDGDAGKIHDSENGMIKWFDPPQMSQIRPEELPALQVGEFQHYVTGYNGGKSCLCKSKLMIRAQKGAIIEQGYDIDKIESSLEVIECNEEKPEEVPVPTPTTGG